MSDRHIKQCFHAMSESIINRKRKIKTAYKEKDGRLIASLGILKTAAGVAGYAIYSAIPESLRCYEALDRVDEVCDGEKVADYETG